MTLVLEAPIVAPVPEAPPVLADDLAALRLDIRPEFEGFADTDLEEIIRAKLHRAVTEQFEAADALLELLARTPTRHRRDRLREVAPNLHLSVRQMEQMIRVAYLFPPEQRPGIDALRWSHYAILADRTSRKKDGEPLHAPERRERAQALMEQVLDGVEKPATETEPAIVLPGPLSTTATRRLVEEVVHPERVSAREEVLIRFQDGMTERLFKLHARSLPEVAIFGQIVEECRAKLARVLGGYDVDRRGE